MSFTKTLKHLFIISLILGLSACGNTRQSESSSSIVQGSLGVASLQASSFSSQSAVQGVTVELLNEHLSFSFDSLGLASSQKAIRGLNAAVLSNSLSNLSSSEAKPLFSLSRQAIIAVNKQGDIVASTPIEEDGSWNLAIDSKKWEQAGTLGLMQGYSSDDGLVCEKPLEYKDAEGERSAALLRFDTSMSDSQVVIAAGLFNFDEVSGNPTSGEANPEPSDDEFEPSCDNGDVIEVSVTADFTWQTPESLNEASLYDFGFAYGIDTSDLTSPAFVTVAPLNSDGVMDMIISKDEASNAIPMALVISDARLLNLVSLTSLSSALTPTFDLNAAIAYSNPDQPKQISVGNDGYAYDPARTRGGMAQISGVVTNSLGNVEAGALVIGVIDSAEVIAFNLAVSQADGSYELLLPATSKDLPYFIVALNADNTEVGLPVNIPAFRGDSSDPRYVIEKSVAYAGADIHLKADGSSAPVEQGDISGTVEAAAGQTLEAVTVKACTADFAACPYTTKLDSSNSSASFSLKNVAAGQYVVVAQQDSNSDGKIEFEAVYSLSGNEPSLLSPPAENIVIKLLDTAKPYQESVQFIRPEDFTNGSITLELDNLGSDESVALIAVHGSQSLAFDGLEFDLDVKGLDSTGTNAVAINKTLNQGIEELLEAGHHEFLDFSEANLNKIRNADIASLFETDKLSTQAFDKCPAPYNVGKTCDFWVLDDFNPDGSSVNQLVSADLVSVSEHAYWFIQKEDLGDLSEAELNSLIEGFETITVPSNEKYFGDFQDVDKNGKIIILFSHLFADLNIAGYVYGIDYFPNSEVEPFGLKSNEADIFYAATPSSVADFMPRDFYMNLQMPGTITHELKHLIAVGYRIMNNLPPEPAWSEEPSAVAAEELASQGTNLGVLQKAARLMFQTPENFRVVYEGRPQKSVEDSGMYFYNWLLHWRQAERIGHERYWKALIKNNKSGIENLVLASEKAMPELMMDWGLTLLFDNTFLIDGYELDSLNLRDGTWPKLGYQALVSGSRKSRSLQYFVAKGQNQTASIEISTTNPEPYFVLVRFKGSLPW